jgi:hypothetical protein
MSYSIRRINAGGRWKGFQSNLHTHFFDYSGAGQTEKK